ncbi:MAG: HNH endonuclease [Psychrobacter sp.]|nr:HNH endonuclease [Psychrobacter sp.]
MSDKSQLYKGEIKELSISMQMDWRNEMKIHLSERYLEELDEIRKELNACYFCGFVDGKYMEAHHLDGDHDNFDSKNIVPCCTLCHRVQHIGWIGVKNHGSLVFIPNNIKTPSEEIAPSVAIFNQLQRFYMLQDYYDQETKDDLSNIVLFSSLENTVLNNKRIVMTKSYAEYLEGKEVLKQLERDGAGVSREDAAVAEKDELTGDSLVATEVGFGDNDDMTEMNSDGSNESILNLASASLLDVVVSLGDIDKEHEGKSEDNPALKFLQEQKTSKHGRFMVLFNPTVFEPFEPYADYTFYERIAYYLSLDYFNPKKMGSVLEGKLPE